MRLLLDRYALGSGLTPLYHNFPSKPGNVHILYIFIYGLYIYILHIFDSQDLLFNFLFY